MWPFLLSTWRSGFRNRVFRAVFLLGIAIAALAWLSSSFSTRQPLTVALDVGVSGLRFALILFAIVLVQDLVGREIERRTVVLTLSYPAPRAAWLAGRYLGVMALSAIAAAGFALILALAVMAADTGYDQGSHVALGTTFWATIFGLWIEVGVVAAFTLWIATLSTVTMLPLTLGALFAVASRSLGAVFDYLAQGAEGQTELVERFGPALETIRWFLPDLSRLDWRAWPMYGVSPGAESVAISLIMAFCYIAALLCLAIHSFSRREFS